MEKALLVRHGPTLLGTARAAIRHWLDHDAPLPLRLAEYDAPLSAPGAAFVTLRQDDELRGCIGSAEAWRPLIEDVAENARAAASRDPRFPPVGRGEIDRIALSVSVLSAPVPLPAAREGDLLDALRPGDDGLILEDGSRRALFLPAVWEMLPDPRDFLAHLKRKAGLPPDHWSSTLRFHRFGAASVSE